MLSFLVNATHLVIGVGLVYAGVCCFISADRLQQAGKETFPRFMIGMLLCVSAMGIFYACGFVQGSS